jgi:hypothetical protein
MTTERNPSLVNTHEATDQTDPTTGKGDSVIGSSTVDEEVIALGALAQEVPKVAISNTTPRSRDIAKAVFIERLAQRVQAEGASNPAVVLAARSERRTDISVSPRQRRKIDRTQNSRNQAKFEAQGVYTLLTGKVVSRQQFTDGSKLTLGAGENKNQHTTGILPIKDFLVKTNDGIGKPQVSKGILLLQRDIDGRRLTSPTNVDIRDVTTDLIARPDFLKMLFEANPELPKSRKKAIKAAMRSFQHHHHHATHNPNAPH